jgi:choline-sulfatase
MVSNYDLLPSVVSYLGMDDAMNHVAPRSPGRDFSPILRGEDGSWDNVVYYEMEYVRAIRTDQYKYVHRPTGPFELYDLTADPYEKFNLYGQPEHAALQKQLKRRLDDFFRQYADPKYDLYNGGGSKASLLSHRSPRR